MHFALIFSAAACEEIEHEETLDRLGLIVRTFDHETGRALLTNVCAPEHVRDANDRRLPISITRVIRHGDLLQYGDTWLRYLHHPVALHPPRFALDEVAVA